MNNPSRTTIARNAHEDATEKPQRAARGAEGGYALVALLALMTILALVATSAAPNIRQQYQREQEREAIIRGEEVAEAIERYIRLMGREPKSMEELLEGANPPGRTKKVRVLRAYAARDPLARTNDGEWRLIQPRSREIGEFQQALITYMEGRPLQPSQEQWKNQARMPAGAALKLGEGDGGAEDESTSADVPFVGVASRSRRDSVILYFGIEQHDGWVFTPIFR